MNLADLISKYCWKDLYRENYICEETKEVVEYESLRKRHSKDKPITLENDTHIYNYPSIQEAADELNTSRRALDWGIKKGMFRNFKIKK